MMSYQPTVAVDFDGVLHSYTSKFDIERLDAPEPGAQQFIQDLIDAGYRVVVYSTRASTAPGLRRMRRWLLDQGFPQLEVSAEKPMAVAYVDDRAVPYRRGRGFGEVENAVHHLAEHGAHCNRLDCDL